MCSRAFRTEQILCVLYPTHIVSEWRLATPLKIFLSQHHLKKNILGSHILLPQKSKKKNAKKYGQKKVTVALHNFKFNLLLTAVYLPFSCLFVIFFTSTPFLRYCPPNFLFLIWILSFRVHTGVKNLLKINVFFI